MLALTHAAKTMSLLTTGAVLAQNSGGHCPISPFITDSIFSVLQNRKKYELHIGLYLKSIISRVANSVMGYTLPPVETRPKGLTAGVASPSPSTRGSGERCTLPSGVWGRENLDFGAFGDLRNHVRMVS